MPTSPAGQPLERPPARPGVVLAWAEEGIEADDRAPIGPGLTIGRSASVGWSIPDQQLSRSHLEVRKTPSGFAVEDLGSSNGTTLDGHRLEAPREARAGAVIRAGGCVFVLVDDLSDLAPPGEPAGFGFAGAFHSAAIVRRLRVAARTGRHVLLEGETGSGKELAAEVVHEVLRDLGRPGPLVRHNAACFAGEDDAVAALFGVAKGVFTAVSTRVGALEQAAEGTLFLDEVHNLPPRAQRSLLRFAEDGVLLRLGEASGREVDVRLVLGTNLAVSEAVGDGRLAHDLVARAHRVAIPSLSERRADVPSIFVALLSGALERPVAEEIARRLDARTAARLCAHDYSLTNVRALQDIAAVVGARIAEGEAPALALAAAVDEALGPATAHAAAASEDPYEGSPYERHKEAIVEAYHEVEGNLTRLEATLRARGVPCTRRWLSVYLDRWGLRSRRKRSR